MYRVQTVFYDSMNVRRRKMAKDVYASETACSIDAGLLVMLGG